MNFALLIAGVCVGLICGFLADMIHNRKEIEELEAKLEASIPKLTVIKALNGAQLDPKAARQKRKDCSNIYWNGAIEAVKFILEDDLK